MRIEPDNSTVTIVLVGSFNPVIFHPEWFARHGLLTEQEKNTAIDSVELIHREINSFRMEWLSIRVERERFIAETREAPFRRLADFMVRTFKERLIHTPVNRLGINRLVDFNVGDEATRNRIGKALAPHEPWGEWAQEIEGRSAKKRGGMRTLVMEQSDLDDRERGHIQAKIAPSRSNAGIFMEINDHYEAKDPAQSQGCEEMIDVLDKNFDESIRRSEWIIDQIMALKDRV